MIVLTYIRKIYKALSADASPAAIALAALLGLTAGCVPLRSGFTLFVLLVILFFRVQITTAILFWAVGRIVTLAGMASLFADFGGLLLETEALKGFWTWFLNLPGVAWFGFGNYAILGGAVCGFVLGAALFVPIRLLVIAYRRWVHDRVSKNRFFRWLTNFWVTKLVKFVFVGT